MSNQSHATSRTIASVLYGRRGEVLLVLGRGRKEVRLSAAGTEEVGAGRSGWQKGVKVEGLR